MSQAIQQKTLRLMVMAGGTGGHVYPAIAVADALQAKGWDVVWLATEGGMENRLIADKPYKTAVIQMKGVRGKGLMSWIQLPVKLMSAMLQARKAIKQYQPTVVLGMGGFAAFPGGVMAKLSGLPLVIHEQNSVAGLTNKVLSLLATRVLAGFPQAFKKNVTVVGNPVRKDLYDLPKPSERYASHAGALKVLVVGGSLGAAALNEILPKAFALIAQNERPEIVHQSGEKHLATLQANYEQSGVIAQSVAFIKDMAGAYQWADLVICRAGALTVAEITSVGVASVLVPFPYAVDDHQTSNARHLVDGQAAILIPQHKLEVETLAALIKDFTRAKCAQMAEHARSLALPNATNDVAKVIESVAKHEA